MRVVFADLLNKLLPSLSAGRATAILLVTTSVAVGCGSGGDGTELLNNGTETVAEIEAAAALASDLTNSVQSGTANQTAGGFLSDAVDTPSSRDVFELYPDIVDIESSTSSSLRIAYTADAQKTPSTLTDVETVWAEMSSCLGVTAPAPLVILKSTAVEPVSSSDDTIFDFTMNIAASAHDLDGATDIQLIAGDLDPSGESQGFYLRSILGRYLWRSNQLAERDYDYSCAASRD